MADLLPSLLQALISAVARGPIPEEELLAVVGPAKQQKAFNLCDGTRRLTEIAKEAGLDHGNFSKTVARWIQVGIMYRVGDGNDARLRHVYPLRGAPSPKASTGRGPSTPRSKSKSRRKSRPKRGASRSGRRSR